MPTDHDATEHPELAPDPAVAAPKPGPAPDHTDATTAAAQPDGEAMLREWEGLPPDSLILVPSFNPPPMRTPDHAWAMRVNAVGIVGDDDPDQRGEVDVFAGSWVDETPASGLYDGDLVVRLTQPTNPGTNPSRDPAVDVEMVLAHHGQWQRVGCWRGLDDNWPHLVAPTAHAVMGLHTELVEAAGRCDGASPAASPPVGMSSRGGGLVGLLEAGLVTPGEEFVWDRRHHGVRHLVRVRADGALALADGRVYASPTAATTALGGVNQGGWTVFKRVSDGRTLAELRAEAHGRRKN